MPQRRYVYVADDTGFPYGGWDEAPLQERMIKVFGELIARYSPEAIVIACNTATTLGIHVLRDTFPDTTFIGTVPAIKPAAERTASGLVSVLATPGTVQRQYTRELIEEYASKCEVKLVGSTQLAALAETYIRGGFVDENAVGKEIQPCFVEKDGHRTDIVVLACTHYTFLANRMRKMAPWPVDWIDTAEAIARRAYNLLGGDVETDYEKKQRDLAYFTSESIDAKTRNLLLGFGLRFE